MTVHVLWCLALSGLCSAALIKLCEWHKGHFKNLIWLGRASRLSHISKPLKNIFGFCKILFHVFFGGVYKWQKKKRKKMIWACSVNEALMSQSFNMGSVFKNGPFFTLPLLHCLIILSSTPFSSVPSVISMQMSSSLHYPDCDWARFVSGLALQHPLLSLKWRFNLLQLAGVTLLLINLQHYCLFDFGMRWAFCCIHVRWVQ